MGIGHTTNGALFTEMVLEIFKTNGLLTIEGDILTKEFDLSSARWKVLGAIEISNHALTVPQIARTMGLTRQAVQRLVDIMAKSGLLEFQHNPHHKKANLVVLSKKGKAIYDRLSNKQKIWANHFSDSMNSDDLKTAVAVIKNISKKIEQA